MKKSKILAGILAFTLLLTGCGGEKPTKEENMVTKTIENMEKLNNFHVAYMIDMETVINGEMETLMMSIDQDIDQQHKTFYTFLSMSLAGNDTEGEAYEEYRDGKMITYENGKTEEDPWIKSTQVTELGSDFAFLANAKDIKEISNENGKKTYEAIIDKETVKALVFNTGLGEEKAEYQESRVKYIIDDNDHVTRFTITIPVIQEEHTTMINMTANFSQFNKVGDIEIPEEIIANAVEAQ